MKAFKEYRQGAFSKVICYSIAPITFMGMTLLVIYYNPHNPLIFIVVFVMVVFCLTNIAPFAHTEHFVNRIRLMRRLRHSGVLALNNLPEMPIILHTISSSTMITLDVDGYMLCVWNDGEVSLFSPDNRCVMGSYCGGPVDRINYNIIKHRVSRIITAKRS